MTEAGEGGKARAAADLERLFAPRSIALVGIPRDLARPGARPLHFLRRHGYPGRLYPVNPGHRMIGDLPAYPTVDAVPEPPDVAWIGLPAGQAADAILACGRARIPFAVVLGAGFAETGEPGAVEQERLVECARQAGVRLLGPNTVGFVNAWDRVALTFSTVGKLDALAPGPVALLSQSGGLGGCLLDRAAARGLGVGLFVSTGNEADLSLADYLDWLVEDGRVRAIACLVEQVRQPDRVAAAVERAAARGIAVVALKLGASPTGSRAARSHTGSLAGGREAWRAWARSAGLLEVTELDHLVETAAHLARVPALEGPRMAMATSSGGVAVLLADALEPRGFTFAPLAEETVRRVGALLPPYVTVANPLDITAGLPDETFGEVLAAVARDPGIDVVVVPLTMATAGGGAARASHVIKAARGSSKPLVVCWPGGTARPEGSPGVRRGAGAALRHGVELRRGARRRRSRFARSGPGRPVACRRRRASRSRRARGRSRGRPSARSSTTRDSEWRPRWSSGTSTRPGRWRRAFSIPWRSRRSARSTGRRSVACGSASRPRRSSSQR